METINWKVDGMSCSNCALTIGKYLENAGLKNVKVSLVGGEVSFEKNEAISSQIIQKGIEGLGYSVVNESTAVSKSSRRKLNKYLRYLLLCLPFTVLLILHMFLSGPLMGLLMNPWLQLLLCLPVYVLGMKVFGRSALQSIRNGLPNMNVLIAIGATAAFGYSLAGTILHLGEDYLFYETSAAIVTLIFLGNYLEDISIQSTQTALNRLAKSQKVMAQMIGFDEDHHEIIMKVENAQLRSGDLVLINTGDQVPSDCKILWGEANVNESIITGESVPLFKQAKDNLIGGSVLVSGTVKAQVTAAPKDSVLSGIINLVKRAQGEKPPVQQLADRISAAFVPIVLVIAALTFVINDLVLHNITVSLMRSVAVLVIACPCAMGLATPAAIAVGLGRAARNGVLFRHARSLELFKNIRQVVFDKTGTLTTGEFDIVDWKLLTDQITAEDFKQIVFSIEKYSNHPVAKCIVREWKGKNPLHFLKVDELKGQGMKATLSVGTDFLLGSRELVGAPDTEPLHNVYVSRNNILLGWIDVRDQLRPEAASVVQYLRGKGIRTILLSGDREEVCRSVGSSLGMDEFISGQSPEQKLDKIASLNAQTPTAMVGDGINDAPALAKASIGISMSDASHIAMQTADVVLVNNGLKNLPTALGLGRHTYITIKQNLFWAFFYNIVAIPFAALGYLTPAMGALIMACSDVVLVANSVRLFLKKVD